MYERSYKKGYDEGFQEGFLSAHEEILMSLVRMKLDEGKKPQEIADDLEEELLDIQRIIYTLQELPSEGKENWIYRY